MTDIAPSPTSRYVQLCDLDAPVRHVRIEGFAAVPLARSALPVDTEALARHLIGTRLVREWQGVEHAGPVCRFGSQVAFGRQAQAFAHRHQPRAAGAGAPPAFRPRAPAVDPVMGRAAAASPPPLFPQQASASPRAGTSIPVAFSDDDDMVL